MEIAATWNVVCATELLHRMLLLVVLLTATIAQTISATEQNTQDCNLRFLTCSSNEKQKRPVCGSDNLTYQSRCHLLRAQCQGLAVTMQHRGRCKEKKLCLAQVLSARNHQPLLFVPSCLEDGSFAPVQCHYDTGYCWCVTPVGKPIPNSSVRNARPNCSRRGKANTKRRSSIRGRKPKKGCGREDRSTFNKNLIKIFKTEYNRISTSISGEELQTTPLQDSDRQVLDWKFSTMDKDNDFYLMKTEYRDLRRLVKKVVKPKRCAKTFTKLCDLDHDDKISKEEWGSCLGLDFNYESHEDDGAEETKGIVMQESVTTLAGHLSSRNHDSSQGGRDEQEASDCHSDRKAVLEEQLTSNSELYVPDCTPDGRYQTIQCYKSTGYCWCVHEDNGKPIPGTSVKDQIPKCDSVPAPSRPMSGCPDPNKQTFILELMDLMKKKMEAATNKTEPESSALPIKETWQVPPEVQIATWNFLALDKNKNKVLERKEWKNFRALVSSKPQLRRCGKRLPRYCDVNNDRKISITEWLNCLNAQRNNTITVSPTSASRRRGLNPLQIYLKGED